MIKTLAISTSLNKDSISRELLFRIEDLLIKKCEFTHINFLEYEYSNIRCDICSKCKDTNSCIKETNRNVIDIMKSTDIIIFATPIYYGGISGITKSYLESMYILKNNDLKNKKVIALFSSAKQGQEGIAIMELLPWCFKYGATLVQVETVNENSTEEEKDQIIKRISEMILENKEVEFQMDLEFGHINYFDKQAGIPVMYDVKKVIDKT